MREMMKSMLGFSLSMAVFGVEQLRSVVRKADESGTRGERLRNNLDSMSTAAENRFGDRAQRVYEAGDTFQREMIDMAFDLVKPAKTETVDEADDTPKSPKAV